MTLGQYAIATSENPETVYAYNYFTKKKLYTAQALMFVSDKDLLINCFKK